MRSWPNGGVVFLALVLSPVGGAILASAQTQAPQAQTPASPPASAQTGPPPPAPQRGRLFQTVVIDPGHGGADAGARGAGGLVEKDLVLAWAKRLKSELQSRLNLTVLLTRDREAGPTLDERAAVANASHADLFLSVHVSTAGPPRTAQVYFWRPPGAETNAQASAASSRFISWETAQTRGRSDSERFAALLAVELSRALAGSPAKPAEASLRGLRSVTGPAVAIEVSSASAKPEDLAGIDQILATSIAAAIQAFRPGYERAAVSAAKPAGSEAAAANPSGAKDSPGPQPASPPETKPQPAKSEAIKP